MKIARLNDTDELAAYTAQQIKNLLPLPRVDFGPALRRHLDTALMRAQRCIDSVKVWERGVIDPLHSSQYCILLYYWSNTIWRESKDRETATALFLLNKALNGIDLFYEIEMPEKFFIGHSVGIVLAKATYGEHLVLYQNSTVGKNHGVAPVIEDGVVMYPNTAIIGRCQVRARSVLAQGTSVINRDTQGECYVFSGPEGELRFTRLKRNVLEDIFRL